MDLIGAIIGWIIVGGIAGWLASVVMGTNDRQGCLTDIILGIVGSFIGGFIFDALNLVDDDTTNIIVSIIVAFVGAVILLAIAKQLRRA